MEMKDLLMRVPSSVPKQNISGCIKWGVLNGKVTSNSKQVLDKHCTIINFL